MSPKSIRPQALSGYTMALQTPCGKIFVTVTYDPGTKAVLEVFIRFGKAGGCGSAMADVVAKLISYGLRSGMEPLDAIKALDGTGCHAGSNTCYHNVAKGIKAVMISLETGKDINDVLEDLAKPKPA
ncbi:MAG: TSCPD domain-containing protein [Geobacter sp.]|nr:MAG: TSCPD domain-containing protein [Geobacter sp.]